MAEVVKTVGEKEFNRIQKSLLEDVRGDKFADTAATVLVGAALTSVIGPLSVVVAPSLVKIGKAAFAEGTANLSDAQRTTLIGNLLTAQNIPGLSPAMATGLAGHIVSAKGNFGDMNFSKVGAGIAAGAAAAGAAVTGAATSAWSGLTDFVAGNKQDPYDATLLARHPAPPPKELAVTGDLGPAPYDVKRDGLGAWIHGLTHRPGEIVGGGESPAAEATASPAAAAPAAATVAPAETPFVGPPEPGVGDRLAQWWNDLTASAPTSAPVTDPAVLPTAVSGPDPLAVAVANLPASERENFDANSLFPGEKRTDDPASSSDIDWVRGSTTSVAPPPKPPEAETPIIVTGVDLSSAFGTVATAVMGADGTYKPLTAPALEDKVRNGGVNDRGTYERALQQIKNSYSSGPQ